MGRFVQVNLHGGVEFGSQRRRFCKQGLVDGVVGVGSEAYRHQIVVTIGIAKR